MFSRISNQIRRSFSPVPSHLSMKSDFSMDRPIHFSDGPVTFDPRISNQIRRSVSPVPSHLSMK
ncbi:hypothetical protein J4Q44_G00382200, partial [Coregonus suidteri]